MSNTEDSTPCPRCGGHGTNVGHPALIACGLCDGEGVVTAAVLAAWRKEHPNAA